MVCMQLNLHKNTHTIFVRRADWSEATRSTPPNQYDRTPSIHTHSLTQYDRTALHIISFVRRWVASNTAFTFDVCATQCSSRSIYFVRRLLAMLSSSNQNHSQLLLFFSPSSFIFFSLISCCVLVRCLLLFLFFFSFRCFFGRKCCCRQMQSDVWLVKNATLRACVLAEM